MTCGVHTVLTTLTLVFLQLSVLHVRLGVLLLQLQLHVFLAVLLLELLSFGLDHLERRESEERRRLRRHRSLLLQLLWYLPLRRRRRRRWWWWRWRRQCRLQAVLRTVADAVVVVMVVVVVVAVFVAVQDMFTCAEVVGFGVLLQLVRPVLGVLVLVVLVVVVVMELHFLRLLLTPLPLVSRRRQLPALLLLPLLDEPVQTLPQSLFFHFRTEQVDPSCHLCTYSTFKGTRACFCACPRKSVVLSPLICSLFLRFGSVAHA